MCYYTHMNISFKKSSAAIAAAAAVLCAAAAVFYAAKPRVFTVAFYDIPDAAAAALTVQIRRVLEDSADGRSGKLEPAFKTFAADQPLERYLTQKPLPDLVFTFAGKSAESAAQRSRELNPGLAPAVLASVPVSIRKTALDNRSGRICAVPLLLDHYELAVRRDNPADGQLAFAGADGPTLLAFAGCVAEAAFGADKTAEFADGLRRSDLHSAPIVRETAELIASYINSGTIPPYVFRITQDDLAQLMQNGTPSAVFMPLSFRRTVPFKGAERYQSSFFPAVSGTPARALAIPVLYGVPLARTEKRAHTAETVLKALSGADVQYALSSDAGLAPVHARAETADVQAADVRYWAAAAGIVPSAGQAAFETVPQQNDAAGKLRALILEYVDANAP